MARQPEARGRARGQDRRAVPHREHAVKRRVPRGGDDRLERRVLLVEAHADGAIAPGIVELLTSVGRKHDLDAELARRHR